MNGGYSETVEDGVMYRLVECDSVAVFADRGLYFAMSSGSFICDNRTFIYNEQTGEIKANPDYSGSSVVFNLPLDKSLANPEKAEQYLNELFPSDKNIDNPTAPEEPEDANIWNGVYLEQRRHLPSRDTQ